MSTRFTIILHCDTPGCKHYAMSGSEVGGQEVWCRAVNRGWSHDHETNKDYCRECSQKRRRPEPMPRPLKLTENQKDVLRALWARRNDEGWLAHDVDDVAASCSLSSTADCPGQCKRTLSQLMGKGLVRVSAVIGGGWELTQEGHDLVDVLFGEATNGA